MVSPVKRIEALYQRLQRARQLVAEDKVHSITTQEAHYAVESSRGVGLYLVDGQCSCPDAEYRSELTGGWCKHRLAAAVFSEQHPSQEADAHLGSAALTVSLDDREPEQGEKEV